MGISRREFTSKEEEALKLGNIIATNTMRLARIFMGSGAIVTIENPSSSTLWHLPMVMKIKEEFNMETETIDYCQWGELYRKRTDRI